MKIKKFTDLEAWKQAHVLVLLIYKITNIAEGFSRQTKKEKQQFYFMAKGSLTELQNQLILARDLHYISSDIFQLAATQTIVVHKLLNGLLKTPQSHTQYKIRDTKY